MVHPDAGDPAYFVFFLTAPISIDFMGLSAEGHGFVTRAPQTHSD
jgi:hypothetical protein